MGKSAKWRKFTKKELCFFVKGSKSYAQVAEKMGYEKEMGSGASGARNMVKFYDFDTSHFTGQGWNKGNFNYERFRYGNNVPAHSALPALKELRGNKCEVCGNDIWLGKPIPLEVHHKDGDHLNSTLENLQLICPNCHALTDNWRGRKNIKTRKEIAEEDFVDALRNNKSIRKTLMYLGLFPVGRNYERAYNLAYKYNIKHIIEQ